MSEEELLRVRTAKTIDLLNGKPEDKREQIREYFHKTFNLYEELFATVKDAAFYYKPDPLRHPLIFYWGHTACFFVNKLVLAKQLDNNVDANVESICAVGVDEMSWDDLNEESYDWPTVSYVAGYRKKVRAVVDALITSLPLTMPLDWNSPMYIIIMGIEHEKIHIETSTVLIRQLKINDVIPTRLFETCPSRGEAPANKLVQIEGGKVALGKAFEGSSTYGWDNEYGTHECEVEGFKASQFLVSNQEYLAFVEAGGYETPRYWTDEGWRWCTYRQAKHPLFWSQDADGHFLQRNMLEVIEMPWNWPVECNQLEAKAFCNWLSEKDNTSIRLPTEDEYMLMRTHMDVQQDQHEWPEPPGNIDLQHFASSCPVDMFKQSSTKGLYDIMGNVWQWTETPMYPFEGFKVHPIYDDFTVPTYDTQHNLIKGGSWVSGGNLATVRSRYAFRRHFYQHAGFRYIQSEHAPVVPDNAEPYETSKEICKHIHAQFGAVTSRYAPQGNFYCKAASLCGEVLMQHLSNGKASNVLEIGCLGGRMSFELARYFDSVTGVEITARLIQVGHRLQEGGVFRYVTTKEGDIQNFNELRASTCAITNDLAKKVTLLQTNPNNMYERLTDFDLVIVSDICRLSNPTKLLESIHKRMSENAVLVVFSSNDWDEQISKSEDWVGGHKVNGENVYTDVGTSTILRRNFRRIDVPDENTLPLVFQETASKFSVKEIEFSAWRKQ
ncbi:hypothetical protein SARC_07064 [Sphaeroforma arctica JP610]|uniref:Sulfatase-modifying factor enzyme domain-containing protein n=1 Tax=Sphaeroforma arctica JP610 TaxID=667725 RepID=A0A0L0FUS2_9EUKA|nr:hypothetical protein SARC_07064 [Sphaeroforma arctica JP610]KNC80580.1 hypothetical protein SARC_07064 [Sphaeroforma arctica JP610]|eukprot:XP_014154482.1 hypothetical protein SARC_07064 [Sphaeroforma arctica JP610]